MYFTSAYFMLEIFKRMFSILIFSGKYNKLSYFMWLHHILKFIEPRRSVYYPGSRCRFNRFSTRLDFVGLFMIWDVLISSRSNVFGCFGYEPFERIAIIKYIHWTMLYSFLRFKPCFTVFSDLISILHSPLRLI